MVYIDESTFHLWQKPSKLWLKRDISFPIQSRRGSSITIIAAIDGIVGLRHFQIITETNKAIIFEGFMRGLCQNLVGVDSVLVMDNLSVHHSVLVQSSIE